MVPAISMHQGLFRVSARAHHVNCIIGFGGYSASRPIFRCDSWLKDLCVGGPFALGGALRLFRKRQRIEIAIGDSGLCQTSQYVRMGSTSLAFDLAENSRSVSFTAFESAARGYPKIFTRLDAVGEGAWEKMAPNGTHRRYRMRTLWPFEK
jgi:hypothetical protein